MCVSAIFFDKLPYDITAVAYWKLYQFFLQNWLHTCIILMSKYSISYLFRTMGSGLYCLNVLLRSERSFYWITKFGPGLGRCTALTESLRLNYSGSLVGLRTELNRAGILQSDGLFIYFFCAPTGYGLSVLPGTDPIITRLLLIFTRYLFF